MVPRRPHPRQGATSPAAGPWLGFAAMSKDPSEERPFNAGPPIPAQDRLWRHPSELGLQGDAGPRVVLHRRPSRSRVLVAAALGLIGGSVLGIGALAASGTLGGGETTTVIEQVAAPAPRKAVAADLAAAEVALPAVARVTATGPEGTTTATGVTVRDDGLVLTTSDVLDAAEQVTVTLGDGTAYPASVIGRDRASDLGVLDIDASGLPVAALPGVRLAEAVDFGDQVVVVATSPDGSAGPTITSGYVSAPSTAVDDDRDGEDGAPMYGMVGVHLAPGNDRPLGGALLLDANGSLLGVSTARVDGATDQNSVAVYATPFDHVRRVFRQVADTGQFTPPELPVDVAELADADADAETGAGGAVAGVDGGVVVVSDPTSPLAVSADLRKGDVITAINGEAVEDVNDHRTEVRRYVPGDEVEVTIVRDGAVENRSVTLGDDPRLR